MGLALQLVDAAKESGALARLAAPWAEIYSDSKAVSAAVLSFHLVPLITAAGAAFAADRATLRSVRLDAGARDTQLRALAGTHRVVVAGLALSLISGVLLFLSDVDTFLGSVWFWVKLALVALLLLNGYVMTRTERALAFAGGDDGLWDRLRTLSLVSAVLWIATTLVGVILTVYA